MGGTPGLAGLFGGTFPEGGGGGVFPAGGATGFLAADEGGGGGVFPGTGLPGGGGAVFPGAGFPGAEEALTEDLSAALAGDFPLSPDFDPLPAGYGV